jgi:hypothetical protein
MFLLLLYVIAGAMIHHDPAIGCLIIAAWGIGITLAILIPCMIFDICTRKKREEIDELYWKARYPTAKSLAEFRKEIEERRSKE